MWLRKYLALCKPDTNLQRAKTELSVHESTHDERHKGLLTDAVYSDISTHVIF